MPTREQLPRDNGVSETAKATSGSASRNSHLAITGGGTEGNEQLTAMTSVILLVMLAVLGLTIVRIRQLTWLHLFLGLLLLGPVALKMGSTGYRFMRYYAGDRAYRDKGPPEIGLRLIAPIVVITTVIVFVSGVVLLFHGPGNRGQLVMIHKASFIVWIVFTAIHVLGHLPSLGSSLRLTGTTGLSRTSTGATWASSASPVATGLASASPGATGLSSASLGATGRWIALAGAVVAGLVIAIVLIPHFGAWTAHGVLDHHHGRG